MDILVFLKIAKELMITNGGLSLVGLLIYTLFHRKEHQNIQNSFRNICTNQEVLTDIQEKVNRYIWKFESEDAKTKQALLIYLKDENDFLMQKWFLGLRDHIRKVHVFDKDPIAYADELYHKSIYIWEQYREERPLNLDLSELVKLKKVNEFVLPLSRVLMLDVTKVLLDESLNGTKETTIESCLMKGMSYFQKTWVDVLGKEFR